MNTRIFIVLAIVISFIAGLSSQLLYTDTSDSAVFYPGLLYFTGGPGFFYTLSFALLPLLTSENNHKIKPVTFTIMVCLGSLVYAIQQAVVSPSHDLTSIFATLLGGLTGLTVVYKQTGSAK